MNKYVSNVGFMASEVGVFTVFSFLQVIFVQRLELSFQSSVTLKGSIKEMQSGSFHTFPGI